MTADHVPFSHSKERLKAHTEMETRPCLWNGSPSCPSACPGIENSSWGYLSDYKALDGQEEAETQVAGRPREGPQAPSSPQRPRILPHSLWAETWPLPHPITTEPYHQKQEQCCPGMDFSVWHDIGRQPPDTRPHSCANSLLTGSPPGGPGTPLGTPTAWSPGPHADPHVRQPLSFQAPHAWLSLKGPHSPQPASSAPHAPAAPLRRSSVNPTPSLPRKPPAPASLQATCIFQAQLH